MTKRQIIFKNIITAFCMSFFMSIIIILINFHFEFDSIFAFISFWWPRWIIGFVISLTTSFTVPPLIEKWQFFRKRPVIAQKIITGVTTSAIINFIIQLLSHGFVIDVFSFWLHKWPISLSIAFPLSLLVITPLTKFLIKVFKI